MAKNDPTKKNCLALYGNVTIQRVHCEPCGATAFVLKGGVLACCGVSVALDVPIEFERMSCPGVKRNPPTDAQKAEILNQQEWRCLYCDKQLGSGRGIEWDHMVPFSLMQDNGFDNFAAACAYCNQRKGSRVFHTIDEARIFCLLKPEKEG